MYLVACVFVQEGRGNLHLGLDPGKVYLRRKWEEDASPVSFGYQQHKHSGRSIAWKYPLPPSHTMSRHKYAATHLFLRLMVPPHVRGEALVEEDEEVGHLEGVQDGVKGRALDHLPSGEAIGSGLRLHK